MLRVGLVGYGDAGRGIHSPLLRRAGARVTAVQTRHPGRSAAAVADHPGVQVVSSLAELLDTGPDVVVLASPSGVHAAQALACVRAGVPVVVDKPLATDAASARTVVQAAEQAGVPLTVFQNRRWDGEHLTLRRLLADGALGEVIRFERRWERWRPVPKDRWRENAAPADGGGLLLDLHTHLVDSAVQLLGPVTAVYAELAARTTPAEDDAFLALTHLSGARSHLGALSLAAAPGPRTRVLGTRAAYVATSFEAEPTAFADLADLDDDHAGWLVAGADRTPVRREPGHHADFYAAVARAVLGGGGQPAMPVQPWDAVHVLEVIDAARVSAAEARVVRLDR
ncbi:Gfo/Idh/MocA family protein [Quadrisphaera sp. GCM10027208]|uniref:Gfo/Idh/MocA family protein n=1 Tax=Quadrisphaera sp. GCM10027208 TaxID=3273423 RepID=UPI0036115BD8